MSPSRGGSTMVRTPTRGARGHHRGRYGRLREAVRGGPRLHGPGQAIHGALVSTSAAGGSSYGRMPIYRRCRRGGRLFRAWSRFADRTARNFDRVRRPVVVADETYRRAGWPSNVDPDASEGASDTEPIGARDELISARGRA